jgi:type IV pilus assembly protein PilA
MRPELQAKMIQHLNKKKGEQGFTLVELLVVIVIIGILTAIALPSFLNQTAKAKQVEAKTNMSSMNKIQQAYRIENGSFSNNFGDLALGRLVGANNPAYTYTIPTASTTDFAGLATTNDAALKSYGNAVTVSNVAGGGGVTNAQWNSIICEATTPAAAAVTAPTSGNACAGGTIATK